MDQIIPYSINFIFAILIGYHFLRSKGGALKWIMVGGFASFAFYQGFWAVAFILGYPSGPLPKWLWILVMTPLTLFSIAMYFYIKIKEP